MKSDQLNKLVALADAQKARDLAVLESALAEDRRLEQEINEMSKIIAQDMTDGDFSEMPYSQFALRLQWADHRVSEAAVRREALSDKIRKLRSLAAISLGKHSALEKLSERAEKQKREFREARTDRETPTGPPPRTDLG